MAATDESARRARREDREWPGRRRPRQGRAGCCRKARRRPNWPTARDEGQKRIADAEKRAAAIIDEAKKTAADEAARIIAAAKAEAEQQVTRAREELRGQVAALAVKGAEQILKREVNAAAHADLLSQLSTEL